MPDVGEELRKSILNYLKTTFLFRAGAARGSRPALPFKLK